MSVRPKQAEGSQKQKSNGWKIYFTKEEIAYLEAEARRLGYRTAQQYVMDKFRQERLAAKKK